MPHHLLLGFTAEEFSNATTCAAFSFFFFIFADDAHDDANNIICCRQLLLADGKFQFLIVYLDVIFFFVALIDR